MCGLCGAGEFFEPRTEDDAPTAAKLIRIYAEMTADEEVISESDALNHCLEADNADE